MKPALDLTTYDAVILDFDGPMCNLFACYPAAKVSDELKRQMVESGWPTLDLPDTADPHELLRSAFSRSHTLGQTIEASLSEAEVIAADSAVMTAGLRPLLHHLDSQGIPIAVATNNCRTATLRWLMRHRINVSHLAARSAQEPEKMKPAPVLLHECFDVLGVYARRALFIGDSLSDAAAAKAAGCSFVGFANKPGKVQRFIEHAQFQVILDLQQLLP